LSRLSAPWVAFLLGLAAGLIAGLVYTLLIDPLQPVNTDPSYLDAAYRKDWVRLVALSYAAAPDLQRVQARLGSLAQEEVSTSLAEVIEECSAEGRAAETMRGLTSLAQALDVYTPAMLAYLRTPIATLSPTPSPATPPVTAVRETPTPRPATPTPTHPPSTSTPTPLPPADYEVASQETICRPAESAGVEVTVTDALGGGVPGVTVWLVWPGGAQRAVTGLKPDRGPGYADFGVEEGQTYSLGVGELGLALVDGLTIESCSTDPEEELVSSWVIVLEPREPG
jgi:hypothetical protein